MNLQLSMNFQNASGKGKEQQEICYNIMDVSDLNLLRRDATKKIGIAMDNDLHSRESCNTVFYSLMLDEGWERTASS